MSRIARVITCTPRRHALWILAFLVVSPTTCWAQSPPAALDAAWATVCAGAQPGSTFFLRCQEILNAGPGSGDRRSDAALGNNFGQLQAQAGNAADRSGSGASEFAHRETAGRMGWFAFAGQGRTSRAGSEFDAGFGGDARRLGLGLDWRLSSQSVLGALLVQTQTDRQFDGGSGRADSRTRALTAFYGSQPSERLGLQVYAGFGELDLDLQRRVRYGLVLNQGTPEQSTVTIDDIALARPGGRQRVAGASLAWDFSKGALSRGLRVGTDLGNTRIDAFNETGGAGLALSRERNTRSSHTAHIGFDLAWTGSTRSGVVMPYLRLDWIQEFKDDRREVEVRFAGDSGNSPIRFQRDRADRSFGEVAVGLSALFAGGVATYIEAERLFAHSQIDHHMISIGVRIER